MTPEEVEELVRTTARRHRRTFWLDGGGSRHRPDQAGGSLVGWLDDDDLSLTYDASRREVRAHRAGRSEVVGDDVFTVLGDLVGADARDGAPTAWVGYLGYAARPDLPALRVRAGEPGPRVPDAVWMRATRFRELEHPAPRPGPVPGQVPLAAQQVPDWYAAAYERVQERLHAGDTYEVNLTYRVAGPPGLDPDPVATYLRLRRASPAPYAGFLRHDVPGASVHLLSASPERYARVDRERWLETKPIKGTTPRGATPEEDAAHAAHLATDPKFRAENLMVTDLLRNDVSMVCEPGTVSVPALMQVESYAAVHQLVSTVRGRLRDDVGTVEALRALFPAGSMTGAPKRRTMEVVAEVESTPRGAYAGAFGWVSPDGRADLGVVIRSLVRDGEGRWEAGTGGGVTVASDVTAEHAESRWKIERLLRVLG